MTDSSLTITFTVDRTPDQAFAAITNVRGWWSGEIDGPTDEPGGRVHLPTTTSTAVRSGSPS